MLKDKEPRFALICFAWNIFAHLIYESQGLCQGEAGELAIVEISAMAHSGVQKQYVSHCVNDASCTYE